MFNIVLLEPEKPDNTGNIGRTCVITGSSLHLIYPIGFSLTRKNIHHAGLDYWDRLKLYKHDSYDDFTIYYNDICNNISHNIESSASKKIESPKIWYATTKAKYCYSDVEFKDGDYIIFGKESAGIPEEILAENKEKCIRIPMIGDERSLNLSNSVAIILYEALRQNGFNGFNTEGNLHNLTYK